MKKKWLIGLTIGVGSGLTVGYVIGKTTSSQGEPAPIPIQSYKMAVSASNRGTTNPPSGVYELTQKIFTAIPNAGYKFAYWVCEFPGSTTPLLAFSENPVTIPNVQGGRVTPIFTPL